MRGLPECRLRAQWQEITPDKWVHPATDRWRQGMTTVFAS